MLIEDVLVLVLMYKKIPIKLICRCSAISFLFIERRGAKLQPGSDGGLQL